MDSGAGGFKRRGLDHDICACPLFGVRNLAVQDQLEFVRCHARSGQNTSALFVGGCGNDDDHVHHGLGAGFEEERNVDHDDWCIRAGHEIRPILGDQRVNCRLDKPE